MMRRRGTGRVAHVVEGLLRKWETGSVKKGNAVRDAWMSAAGEEALGRTQPVSFKKGTLMVIVENSTWLYKLTMEKRGIIKLFNENYSGRQKLEEIRFRIGKTDLE
ncbi:MAG: DUF721 domain-containing protein [Candidatus Omnitrophica bacterium]|nr:DUF721 domain-containing protein [Candidatus Omnitrophota bacterium]MBU1128710.1 DUF721 domain-containing protein [Candidatus Omnitrophota bacterium]MBU1784825.1 DUF721 domain-containing protein [Candidatus Omnitrophota bacterium]MBU1850987.1 DUF721 domain-containing protein [Candidatus Omnitrophota bacterium]